MGQEKKGEEETIRNRALEIYKKIIEEQMAENGKNSFESEIYYKDLTLVQPNEEIGLAEQDVYVVKSITDKGKAIYSIYSSDMLVAKVDENGNIKFSNEYREKVGKIDKRFKMTIDNNTSKFEQPKELADEDKMFSEQELKDMAEGEKKNSKNKNQGKETENKNLNEKDNGKTTTEDKELEQIAQKAGMDKSDIASCTKINPQERVTDMDTFESIANVQGKYEKIYVINANGKTNKNSKFAFIGITKDGKAEYLNGLETRGATTTDKNIYSINRDGTAVKEKQTTEMYTTSDQNKMFSVTKGQYGIIEVDYIRRSQEENKFISAPVATEKQKPTTEQVKKFMDSRKTTNRELDNTINKVEEQTKENESKRTDLSRIDNNPNNDTGYDLDEEITMHDGKITTLRKEAERNNIPPEEYIKIIENTQGDCTAEKIERVNEGLEQEKIEGRGERLTPEEEEMQKREGI